MAIAFGLSTFSQLLATRRVCVWSDNTGSESATRKGAARSFDHSCIIHSIWLKAALIQADLHILRVPTEDNVADLPPREDYVLLQVIGASRVEPVLDAAFWKPDAWEALTLQRLM